MGHIPWRVNVGPDGLSRRPQGAGDHDPEEEDDPEETMKASCGGLKVEQGPESNKRRRAYELFVGLRLVDVCKSRWKKVGEWLGNLKRPEGKTTKKMLQFWPEPKKCLLSDGIFYWRRKTNEPPANVFVGTERKLKSMEAARDLRGHRGRKVTLRNVVEQYWWPEVYVNVNDWVETCE
jgi:hypothetical protein